MMYNAKEYDKLYRERNHDKQLERVRIWKKNNPDHYKIDTSIIYGIYRRADYNIVYIGSCTTKLNVRISRHKNEAFTRNSNYEIHKAMRDQGWDAFEFVIIDDTVDFNPMFTEDYFIQMLNPIYNVMNGNKTRKIR